MVRGGAAVLAAMVAVAGCGAGSRRAAPPTTRAPATTVPSVDTPPGARLAIGTSQGMEIWSATTGVFTVGPTMRDVEVSHIAWSLDGRVLSWQTVAAGSHRHGAELWYVDVATGTTFHAGPLAAGGTFGPVVVTDAGVLTLGSTVVDYPLRRGAPPTAGPVPAVVPPPGATVEAWDHGWIIEPSGTPTGQRVVRVTTTGAGLPPDIVLDAGTSHGPYFDLEAVDRRGRLLAAELGTHGRGCEVAGTAELWTATLATGAVRYSTPPVGDQGVSQRFWAVDVSGRPGTVYASTFDCEAGGRHRGRALSTVLWRFRAGDWHRIGAGIVTADQAADGPLAVLHGAVRVDHGVAAVTGAGTVSVAGHTVASGGQALAWDPVADVPSVSGARADPGSSDVSRP